MPSLVDSDLGGAQQEHECAKTSKETIISLPGQTATSEGTGSRSMDGHGVEEVTRAAAAAHVRSFTREDMSQCSSRSLDELMVGWPLTLCIHRHRVLATVSCTCVCHLSSYLVCPSNLWNPSQTSEQLHDLRILDQLQSAEVDAIYFKKCVRLLVRQHRAILFRSLGVSYFPILHHHRRREHIQARSMLT